MKFLMNNFDKIIKLLKIRWQNKNKINMSFQLNPIISNENYTERT